MIAVRSSWFLCWVGLLFPLLLRAAEEPVSFAHNGKSIRTDSSAAGFSFWVAGHIYGNPGKSVFPSPSMLAQVDTINASPAAFLILLGDNYRRLNAMEVGNFRKYFLDKLEIAAFNAIGNHDLYTGTEVQNYALYREYFPSTYYRFFYRNCLFLILDSELANGSIRDEQLDFFRRELRAQIDQREVTNVFICSHRDIWLGNHNNFREDLHPILDSLEVAGLQVYWLSGDMPTGRKSLTYYHHAGVTYLHTHIADNERDKIVFVEVAADGQVRFEPFSLTGAPVRPIEDYDEFFHEDEPFDLVAALKNVFTNQVYYLGLATGLCCWLAFFGIRKIVSRKKHLQTPPHVHDDEIRDPSL